MRLWYFDHPDAVLRVCGYGTYVLIAPEGIVHVHNLGFNPAGAELQGLFQCRECGHVDLF